MATATDRPKPFSGESIRRYEEGIDEPGNAARAALAKVFGKSEQYIEFGDSSQKAKQPEAKYNGQHGMDSPDVVRLVKAFAWLMPEEQVTLLRDLEAKAMTNRQIAKSLGPRFSIKSDQEMLEHLKKSGDFPPGARKKATKGARRRGPSFREEDPE